MNIKKVMGKNNDVFKDFSFESIDQNDFIKIEDAVVTDSDNDDVEMSGIHLHKIHGLVHDVIQTEHLHAIIETLPRKIQQIAYDFFTTQRRLLDLL